MDLALKHVKSDESHYATFICQSCHGLPGLDAVVTGSCSHLFCRSCMDEWTSTSSVCPTCQVDLKWLESNSSSYPSNRKLSVDEGVNILPLEKAQPLAYASLMKIQICCPHCTKWRGDYGKFQKHLTQCPFLNHRETSSVHDEYEGKNRRRKSPPQSPSRERDDPGPNSTDGYNEYNRTKIFENSTTPHELSTARTNEDQTDSNENSISVNPIVLSTEETNLSDATTLKEKGNARFNRGEYEEARLYYDQAVDLVSDLKLSSIEDRHTAASLYCNRGATHGKERNYEKALSDYDSALRIAPDFFKAYSRKLKALSALGLIHEQKACLEAGVLHIPEEKTLLEDLRKIKQVIETMDIIRSCLNQQNYVEAKDAGNFLMTITDHLDAVLLSAEADASVGKIDSALEKCDFILNKEPNNILGLKTKGFVNMVAGRIDLACNLLKEAAKYDRVGQQAVKESYKLCRRVQSDLAQGRSNVNKADGSRTLLKQATEYYSSLIDEDLIPPRTPLKCLLRTERAEIEFQLQHYQLALSDAHLVTEIEVKNIRAWVVQCDSLIALGRSMEARDQLLEIKRDWGCDNENIKKAYSRAKFECSVSECDKELRSMVSHLVEKKKTPSFSSEQTGLEKRSSGRVRRKTAHGGMVDRDLRRKGMSRKDSAQNVDRGLTRKASVGDRPIEHRHLKGRNGLAVGGRLSPQRAVRQSSPTPPSRWDADKGKLKQKERPVMSEEDARRRVSMI